MFYQKNQDYIIYARRDEGKGIRKIEKVTENKK
jgi:hypothetical protein